MTKQLFSTLLSSLHASLDVPFTRNVEHMSNLVDRLDLLYAVLRSNSYPCPICYISNSAQSPETIGTISLDWDHETDDMGYKVNSWPVFTSECEDPEREAETRRGNYIHFSVIPKRNPRNHAEQLNDIVENEGYSSDIEVILGAAQERRRLRVLLGIPDLR